MPDPTTPAKGLTQPTVGGDNNVWGGLLNTDLSLIDTALGGTLSLSISGNTTLTTTQIQNGGFEFSGTLTGTATITWPSGTGGAGFNGLAVIKNGTSGGHSITCGYSTGASVTVANGETVAIWADGSNFFRTSLVGGGTTIPNSDLQNSSITIAGHTVSLGGTQALAASDLSNGTSGSGEVVLQTSPTITTPFFGSITSTAQPAVLVYNTSTGAVTYQSLTGSGNFVLATSPTITSPTISGSPTFSSPLSVANGGTGSTSYGAIDGTISGGGGAFTVSNADKRQTIFLSGGFFTVTVPAVSGFDGDFQIRLYNSDSNRAKTIAVSGYSNFLLWPKQSVIVQNIDGIIWGLYPTQQRWSPGSPITFYVDNVSGSDNNDGLAAGSGAFATVAHALSVIQKQVDVTDQSLPTIQLTAGQTITESILAAGGIPGQHAITIQGDPSNVSEYAWTANGEVGAAISVTDWFGLVVTGITFGGINNATIFSAFQYGVLDVTTCRFGSNIGGVNMEIAYEGGINITSPTISGNCAIFLDGIYNGHCNIGGTWTVDTADVNVGVLFAWSGPGTIANTGAVSFTGAGLGTFGGQAYSLAYNAVLFLSGLSLPIGGGSATNGAYAVS